jgi:hypothetical protein
MPLKSGVKIPSPVTMKVGTQDSPDTAPRAQAADSMIPSSVALEVRRLSHDLSNALEIIVQCSYLLSTSEIPEESRAWVTLLEQGVQKSTSINQQLRAFIQTHS